MRRAPTLAASAALGLVLAGSQASAAVAIDHAAVGCVVAAKFPRFEARLEPAADVSRARLHFRPAGGPHWYSVAMKTEAGVFTGVLPKPKPSLQKLEYYIEVTDTAFGSSRTSEYASEVAAGPLACKDRVLAAVLESASVLIEGPAGAPLVPVGFEPTNVIAAGPGSGGGTTQPSSPGGSGSTGAAGGPAGPGAAGTSGAPSGAGTGATASGASAGGGGLGKTALVIGGVAAAGAGVAIAASGGSDAGSSSNPGSGGGGGATAPCTPGPVTATLANSAPAQRCGQRFAVDVVVSNGSCSNLAVQSIQLTQQAVAGPFCSAAVTQNTYASPVSTLTAGQARTVMNFQSNVFCCANGPCPGVTTCTYNETFVVQTAAGPVPAGTLTLQVGFDPACAPCP